MCKQNEVKTFTWTIKPFAWTHEKGIAKKPNMRMFVCPICDCVFFSDDHPSCNVYRCQNQDRKYNEDI